EEQDGDFVPAFRKIQRVFGFVANDKETLQARVYIEAINPHGVVVIEEQRRCLVVGIVIEQRFAGNDPVLGVSVAGRGGFSAVEMDDAAHLGLVRFGAVECVVDGE